VHARRLPVAAALMSLVSSFVCLLVVLLWLPANRSLASVLMRWDAGWYRSIALQGYSWNPHSARGQNVAFLPLYPLLERAVHALSGLPVGDFAVPSSIVLQAVAAALLVLIARGNGASERQAAIWVTMFLVSPPVVFDIMGYYSALFCVLCFLALLFAQRGQRWRVAVVLGLASATNPIGIAAAGAFILSSLIEVATSGSVTRRSLAVFGAQALISLSGLIGYLLYLFERFGDAGAFYQAASGWVGQLALSTTIERIVTFEPVRVALTRYVVLPTGSGLSFLIDAAAALVVVALIITLAATKGAWRTFGFWVIVLALVLAQVQSARFGREFSTTRLLVPLGFGVGVVAPVYGALTRPRLAIVMIVVLLAGTLVFLRHLATGQWID
jgi:hypothetical protein